MVRLIEEQFFWHCQDILWAKMAQLPHPIGQYAYECRIHIKTSCDRLKWNTTYNDAAVHGGVYQTEHV